MKYFLIQGVRFKLNGNVITGPVDITDINVDGVSGRGLICQSERTTSQSSPPLSMGDWYLHPESQSTAVGNKIEDSDSDRGWTVTRTTTTAGNRQVKLKREAATGAREGRFTCNITDDNNPIKSLYILYPSEL